MPSRHRILCLAILSLQVCVACGSDSSSALPTANLPETATEQSPAEVAATNAKTPTIALLTSDSVRLTSLEETAQLRLRSDAGIDSSLVKWNSLNPHVVSVTQLGLVTAHAVGSVIILARYKGSVDTAVVQASQIVSTVTVTASPSALKPLQTLQATATAKDARGNLVRDALVTWSSSAMDVATVDKGGLVTAVTPGTATISAAIGGMVKGVGISVAASASTPGARLLSANAVRLPFGGRFSFARAGSGAAPIRYAVNAGTITATGVYTAPSKASTARVIATDATGKSDTALVTVSPTKFGVHSDIAWSRDAAFRSARIADLAAQHVQVARIELLWSFIEWTKGRPDWSVPDAIVNGLTAAGIEPLLVLDGSPPWANGVSEGQDPDYYLFVPTAEAAFKQWVADYSTFIKQAAVRYKGKVRLWEIGNEPNDPTFWKPRVNVSQYARWYTAIDSTIRSVDKNNKTATAGLTALPVWDGNDGMSGKDFLQALYDLGIRPANVAIHPYSNRGQSPDEHIAGAQNFDDIQMIRDLMVRNGQGAAGLWVTEWGWNTRKVSDDQQAQYLERSLELFTSRYNYVDLVINFAQYDSNRASYGMQRADGSAKPSADRFRKFLAR